MAYLINNNEGFDSAHIPSTTFVQANPSNFKIIVQKLTGSSSMPNVGQRISGHRLHERRKTGRKLEINVKNVARKVVKERGNLMASPVSILDACEEEKAMMKKGYYLHPSPIRGSDQPELLVLFPLTSPTNDPSNSSS